jgi:hypothetical protein
MHDDDPEYDIRIYHDPDRHLPPTSIHLDPNYHLPPPRWLEREAHDEIMRQTIHFLTRAIKNRHDDPGQMLRVMVRVERLMSEYVDAGFYSLERQRAQFQSHIRIAGRVARRHIIRCALRDPADATYAETMQRFVGEDEDSQEDVAAAKRHLAEGRKLAEGLWVGKKDRAKFTDMGLDGLIKHLNGKAGYTKYTRANVRAGLDTDEEALQWLGFEAVGLGMA